MKEKKKHLKSFLIFTSSLLPVGYSACSGPTEDWVGIAMFLCFSHVKVRWPNDGLSSGWADSMTMEEKREKVKEARIRKRVPI